MFWSKKQEEQRKEPKVFVSKILINDPITGFTTPAYTLRHPKDRRRFSDSPSTIKPLDRVFLTLEEVQAAILHLNTPFNNNKE